MIPRLNFRALPAHFEVLQCPWLALQHCDIAAFASFRVSPSILMICHGASIGTRFGGGLVRLMYAIPCAPRRHVRHHVAQEAAYEACLAKVMDS